MYRDSCHVIARPFTQLRIVTDAKISVATRDFHASSADRGTEKVERIEANHIALLSPRVFWSEAHLPREMPAG